MREPRLRLAFAGDVGLSARITGSLGDDLASDPPPAFVRILRGADLSFANLEVPLLEVPSPHLKIQGCALDAALLGRMGLGIVSTAGNHIMDGGAEGLRASLRALAHSGIAAVGAGAYLEEALRPILLERRGVKIGWLAFAEGTAKTHRYIASRSRAGAAPLDRGLVRDSVAALRPQVDLLCVSFHQGLNYVHYASPRQREFSKIAAEAGADLVVGHHPHVLQGWERMGTTLVCHSLGELFWDPQLGDVIEPRWAEARRKTAVVTVDWTPGEPLVPRFHPFRIGDDFRLAPLTGDSEAAFHKWMEEITSVYADYDPKIYLEAAGRGVVQHWAKVARYNLRHGNARYFIGLARRVRGRHLRIGWSFLLRKLRLS